MISQFLPHAQHFYVFSHSLPQLHCQPSGISHGICSLHLTLYPLPFHRQTSQFLVLCEKAAANVWPLALLQTRKLWSHMENELAIMLLSGKQAFQRAPFECRAWRISIAAPAKGCSTSPPPSHTALVGQGLTMQGSCSKYMNWWFEEGRLLENLPCIQADLQWTNSHMESTPVVPASTTHFFLSLIHGTNSLRALSPCAHKPTCKSDV